MIGFSRFLRTWRWWAIGLGSLLSLVALALAASFAQWSVENIRYLASENQQLKAENQQIRADYAAKIDDIRAENQQIRADYAAKINEIRKEIFQNIAASPEQDGIVLGTEKLRHLDLFGGSFITTTAPILRNHFFGPGAGRLSGTASGGDNLGVGTVAMSSLTTGNANTAVGNFAMEKHESGTGNVAVGTNALRMSRKCIDCTAVGYEAMTNVQEGVGATAMGRLSLSTATIAGNNTGFGDSTLRFTTGYGNVAVGYRAGEANRAGKGNVYLGAGAALGVPNGNGNIIIGTGSGSNEGQKRDVSNSIAIGTNTITTKDNQVVIGNGDTQEFVLGGVTVTAKQIKALLEIAEPAAQCITGQNKPSSDSNMVEN